MESKVHQTNNSPLCMQQLWDILEQAQLQLNDLLRYRACHKTKWINKMMEILWALCPNTSEAPSISEPRIPQNKHDKNERNTELEISLSELQNENHRLIGENEQLKKVKHEMIFTSETQKMILKTKEEDFMKKMKKREQQFAAHEQNFRKQLHFKEKEIKAIKEENAKLQQIESSLKEDLTTQETDFIRKLESLQKHLLYLRFNNENLKQERVIAEQQLLELSRECDSSCKRINQQISKHKEILMQHELRQKISTGEDKKEIVINIPCSIQRQKNEYSMSTKTFTTENDLIEEIKTLKEEITKLKQQNKKLAEMTTLKSRHTFKIVAKIDSNTSCPDENKTPSPGSCYKFAHVRDELAIEQEKTTELRKEILEIHLEKKNSNECCQKAVHDIKEKDQKLKKLKQHVAKPQTQISGLKLDVEKLKKELTLQNVNVKDFKMTGSDDHDTELQLQEKIKHSRSIVSVRQDIRRKDTINSDTGKYLDVEAVNSAETKLREIEKDNNQLRKEIESLREDKHRETQDFRQKENLLREETKKIRRVLNDEILHLRSQLDHLRDQKEHLAETILHQKEMFEAKDAELEHLRKDKQRLTQEFQEKERSLRKEIENTKTSMKNELQELNSELERQRLEIGQHSDALRNERERYREKGEALENHNAVLQETLETLQTELNCVKTEVASKEKLDKQYQELKLEVDQLRNKHKQLTSELAECQKKAPHKENSLQNKLHELTKENQRLDLEPEKNITQRKTQYTESESVLERYQNEDVNANQIAKKLKEKLKSTTEELQATKRELEETKSRLSRVMGDRLTDNNPNVADLSDKNRPTKLSERYQELYDNQWTDAFETVSKSCNEDEERTIRTLKDILLATMTFCKKEAEKQMKLIIQTFCKGTDIPPHLLKQLKDSRKALAEEYGRQLLQEYKTLLHRKETKIAEISCQILDFVEECFNICWLMTVQDPPVVFGPVAERDAGFNKDHYKAYTKGGDTVNYVVWPVLLLHEGGPVLCKGVAQGQMA